MHSDDLPTALRAWFAATADHLHRGRWIIACWQTPQGRLTVAELPEATACLDDLDGCIIAPDEPLPAAWLTEALDFHLRMCDHVPARPTGPFGLVGVGLAVTKPAFKPEPELEPDAWEAATEHAWIVSDDGAFTVELYLHAAAVGRCEVGDPLWWDRQELFEPLERYRAAITGWPPILPATTNPALPVPASSPADWLGPR
ncbi:hypothetical protein K3N28_05770 [Glycomyces sp. TRM65418]|uniref:hypothetical protein n=1 Tax=Glycomyces sp. TRM65418 TaxID=2867006 RepID=UPI001CE679B9|nr:hypothetical protein [Glycomyces sp. TRM65418]MCC3762576.1 hypothetical protein [Glycomyces sp. TRM65418]QZD56615.1 hypothetical protein K3N28_05730 [Glycomyces sp. TRM65418]